MSKLSFVNFRSVEKWHIDQYLRENLKSKYPMVSLSKILMPVRKRISSSEYSIEIPLVDKIRFSDGQIFFKNGKFPKNDVFIAYRGFLLVSNINFEKGAFCIVEQEEIACSTDYQPYQIVSNDILPEYLNLCLRSETFLNNVARAKPKGMKVRAKWEFIKTFSIPIPSLEEQKQILKAYSSIINDIDSRELSETGLNSMVDEYLTEKLGLIRKRKSTTEMFSVTAFSDIFTWGVDFTKVANVKSKNYPSKKLYQLCSVGSGGTPSRTNPEFYKGNIPWIKTGEVVNEIIYDTEEKISNKAIDCSSAKIYPAGSIIMAMYGQGLTRGRTAKLGIPSSTNQACAVMHNFSKEIYPDYLWIYLMGEYHHIRDLASGNNQPNLSAEKIKNYPVIIPPYDEQVKLAKEILQMKEELKCRKIEATKIIENAKKNFEHTIFE
mgnify:CR=1 FL=1